MAYLHENREEFTNAVNLASEYFHILPIIAEKDYCGGSYRSTPLRPETFLGSEQLKKTDDRAYIVNEISTIVWW